MGLGRGISGKLMFYEYNLFPVLSSTLSRRWTDPKYPDIHDDAGDLPDVEELNDLGSLFELSLIHI